MTPKEELEKHNKQVREALERISSKKTNGGYEKEMQAASIASAQKLEGISLDDFHAYMPMHSYIYAPSREMWPATSINSRIAPVRLFDVRGVEPPPRLPRHSAA